MKKAFKIAIYTWLTWLIISSINLNLLGWISLWPMSLLAGKSNYIIKFLPFMWVPLIGSIIVTASLIVLNKNRLCKLPLFISVVLMNIIFFIILILNGEVYKNYLIQHEMQYIKYDCFYKKSFIKSIIDWNGDFRIPHAEIGKENEGMIWSYQEMKFVPNISKDMHLTCSNRYHKS